MHTRNAGFCELSSTWSCACRQVESPHACLSVGMQGGPGLYHPPTRRMLARHGEIKEEIYTGEKDKIGYRNSMCWYGLCGLWNNERRRAIATHTHTDRWQGQLGGTSNILLQFTQFFFSLTKTQRPKLDNFRYFCMKFVQVSHYIVTTLSLQLTYQVKIGEKGLKICIVFQ